MKTVRILLPLVVALVAGACLAEDKPKTALKLVIIKATYGTADVTEKLKGLANADGVTVKATKDALADGGADAEKKLKVEFSVNDQKVVRTTNDGETFTITLKVGKLLIMKAEYGDLPDGARTDVTIKVQEMVKDDALSVDATNDNFGDPIEGTVKKLKVEYLFDGGAKKEKEVAENETLAVSNKGE